MRALSGLLGAALAAALVSGGVAEATSYPRIAPIEPERILAQKPTQPGGQPQQQAPAQPQQPGQQQADEPARLDPLPTGEELRAYVQRVLAPAFAGIRSFEPVPNVNGVYQVQMNDQALPTFFVNFVEDGNVLAPDRAVAEFQNGFGNCRDSTPGETFEEGRIVMQNFTATCRAQGGNDMFLYMVAGHDDQRTQVLTFMTDPRYASALRPRADRVFRQMTTGE